MAKNLAGKLCILKTRASGNKALSNTGARKRHEMTGTGVVLKLNFQEPGAAKSCQLSANRSSLETGISRNRSWKAGRAGNLSCQETGSHREVGAASNH
jgi:hypothetical protein